MAWSNTQPRASIHCVNAGLSVNMLCDAPHLRPSARLTARLRSWPWGRRVSLNTPASAWAAPSVPPRIRIAPMIVRFIGPLPLVRGLPHPWVAMKQACGSSAADYKLDMKLRGFGLCRCAQAHISLQHRHEDRPAKSRRGPTSSEEIRDVRDVAVFTADNPRRRAE